MILNQVFCGVWQAQRRCKPSFVFFGTSSRTHNALQVGLGKVTNFFIDYFYAYTFVIILFNPCLLSNSGSQLNLPVLFSVEAEGKSK
jgi:hypothetical protein